MLCKRKTNHSKSSGQGFVLYFVLLYFSFIGMVLWMMHQDSLILMRLFRIQRERSLIFFSTEEVLNQLEKMLEETRELPCPMQRSLVSIGKTFEQNQVCRYLWKGDTYFYGVEKITEDPCFVPKVLSTQGPLLSVEMYRLTVRKNTPEIPVVLQSVVAIFGSHFVSCENPRLLKGISLGRQSWRIVTGYDDQSSIDLY